MSSTAANGQRKIVVLSDKKATSSSMFVTHTAHDVAGVRSALPPPSLRDAAAATSKLFIWVVRDIRLGDQLVEEAARSWTAQRRGLGDLLYLERPRPEALLPAQSFFTHVAWIDRPEHWLAPGKMFEVMSLANAKRCT